LLISNERTNRLVHKWRSEEDAVMIGTNTALTDRPALTTRLWPGKNPVRIVLDVNGKVPRIGKLFDDAAETIVIDAGMKDENGKADLHEVMRFLAQRKLQSVLVEGGAGLLQSYIDTGLWDEARVITNERLKAGTGLDSPRLSHARCEETSHVGGDRIDIFYPIKPGTI